MRRRICACTYCAGEPWSVDVSPFSLTALLSAALGPSSLIRKQSFPSVRLHSNHERRGADGRRRFDFRPLGGQSFSSPTVASYILKKEIGEREREKKRRKSPRKSFWLISRKRRDGKDWLARQRGGGSANPLVFFFFLSSSHLPMRRKRIPACSLSLSLSMGFCDAVPSLQFSLYKY